ncbi:hypothetical protein ABZX92_05870 [Lentzea sp. NPDC006480]|uniref:hypothetical protein n=1 Tax=Lentzea sp. NPDC006480 TaxID=3157176 RepID=UPI0033A7A48E
MTPPHANTFNNEGDVETQVGVNNGVIHQTSIYNNNTGEPPETKFENALTYLRGGQPREAEGLLEQVRQAGLVSARFYYYFVLTILSDRTLNELPPREFNKIVSALAAASVLPEEPGGYREALRVIERLMTYIERQDRAAEPSDEELDGAAADFRDLPQARQDEIARHLDMILDGAVQDELDASIAAIASRRRMDNRRENRVWLYFQPDPAPPLLAVPDKQKIDFRNWAMFVLGGLAALWGLVEVIGFATGPTPVESAAALWISLLLVLGGGFLFVWFRIQAKSSDLHRGVREARFQGRHDGPPRHVPAWKVEDITWKVQAKFADERPPKRTNNRYQNNGHDDPNRPDWDRDTAGLTQSMIDWFVRIYGPTKTTPAGLTWLIGWHVRRVKDDWEAGRLTDFRKELRTPWYAKALGPIGVVLVVLLTLSLVGQGAAGPAVLLGAGIIVGGIGAIQVLSLLRVRAKLRAEYAALLHEEEQAYQGWLDLLRDRPLDDEIAYWLRFDVLHLKSRAMRRTQLSSKDIICHVELTEGAPGALRARDKMAPVRYSKYLVKVFLLTDGGVHETEYELDFFTGNVRDPLDTSFRYDAVASARLAEVSVQFAGNRRHIALLDNSVQYGHEFVFQQSLRLSLLDGQVIDVLVEDFKGMTDDSEDTTKLREIAQAASGVQSALHILQAVAREGREWIQRQRDRRRRWWDDYHQKAAREIESGWQRRKEIS